MRSTAFWQLWLLVSVALAGNFGARLLGNPQPLQARSAVAQAPALATGRESTPAIAQLSAREGSSWLLARLDKAETGGELCELLGRLEPAPDPAATYAITSVLERTRLRSVRACAVTALAAQPSDAARSWLIDLAEDPEPQVHRAALEALATQTDSLALATVSDAAHSAALDVRVGAVIALLKARRTETFALAKDLSETLDDPATLGDLVDALAESADLRALPILEALIARGDRATHVRAIAALGALGAKQGVPLLRPYLQVGSEQEFRAAAVALMRLEPENTLPKLLATLREGSVRRRMLVLSTLTSLKLPGVTENLSEMLDSENPGLAAFALRHLATTHDPALESRFIELARRDEPATSRVAVHALLQLGTPGALSELRDLSQSSSEELSRAALEALERFPEARAELSARRIERVKHARSTEEDLEGEVLALVSDPSPAAQGAVVSYFSELGRSNQTLARVVQEAPSATAAELVRHVQGGGDADERRALVTALANRADPRFTEELRRAAADEDDSIREAALRGLLSLGDEHAGQKVAALLDASAPEDRRLGLELFGSRPDEARLAKLEALTSDADSEVATLALGTLKAQVPTRAAKVAGRLFEHGSTDERQAILSSLAGLPAALARPLYEKGLADPNDDTAQRSIELLAGLEGPESAQKLLGVARDSGRSQELRRAAASALRTLGGPLARGNQALLDELSERQERSPAVCRSAS